jgi:hypothetical protein
MTTLTPENAQQEVQAIIKRKYGRNEVTPVSAPDRGLVLGMYAPGGTGKTTVAATITHSELGRPALLLNCRGNPHVISAYGDGRIDVTTVKAFSEVEPIRLDILRDLRKGEFPYKSIILDTTSEMHSILLRDMYGPTADVKWEQHSAATNDLKQLHNNFIDLAEAPYLLNIVFVMQEYPRHGVEMDGQKNLTVSMVAFSQALQSAVPSAVNFLGRLYIKPGVGNPYRRMLDFRPVETVHQAKLQRDPQHPTAKDIPYQVYNPDLGAILDTMRGNKPWPAAKHAG